jgi:hypothetical protein
MSTLKIACRSMVIVSPSSAITLREFHFLGQMFRYHVGSFPRSVDGIITRCKDAAVRQAIMMVYFDNDNTEANLDNIMGVLDERW